MKRHGQWLFNFAAALSLVIFIATAAAWVHTIWYYDGLTYRGLGWRSSTRWQLDLTRGSVWLQHQSGTFDSDKAYSSWLDTFGPLHDPTNYGWQHKRQVSDFKTPAQRWFLWRHFSSSTSANGWSFVDSWYMVAVPYWSILLLSAMSPGLWLSRWRRRRRRWLIEQQICVMCGYDLRATPHRCPECGTIPPAAKGAAA